jgi:hypothetical protein
MAEPVEWTEHPSLAVLLAKCRGGGASPGASSSQMVTVVVLGPIFSSAGVATAFMPYSVDRAGASAESSLLSPSAGEAAVLVEPPSAEGALFPIVRHRGRWSGRLAMTMATRGSCWATLGRINSGSTWVGRVPWLRRCLPLPRDALPCC